MAAEHTEICCHFFSPLLALPVGNFSPPPTVRGWGIVAHKFQSAAALINKHAAFAKMGTTIAQIYSLPSRHVRSSGEQAGPCLHVDTHLMGSPQPRSPWVMYPARGQGHAASSWNSMVLTGVFLGDGYL